MFGFLNWGSLLGSFTAWAVGAAAAAFWAVIGKHVLCWLQWMFCWVISVVMKYAFALLTPAFKLLPPMPAIPWDQISQVFLTGNYFFPIVELVLAAFLCGWVVLTIRLVRFIKQFIPTVAN